MANSQLLNVGDKLTVPVAIAIPQESVSTSETKAVSAATETPTQRTYTVKAGDTLSFIAVKHSTTVAAIASANDIKNINNIKVGQVLVIP
jgi:LysM repeat protein